MRVMRLNWQTETFKYCTEKFYAPLTDFIYLYSLRQSDVGEKIGNIYKLCIVPIREIRLARLAVNCLYCSNTFYLHLTDYVLYINSLYQSNIEKT